MKQADAVDGCRNMQPDLSGELVALPTDWRLVRVGRDKAPIGGNGWFDRENFSPDDAASLNGSSPPAWGLKCGPCSGVVILDLDTEGWIESFKEKTGHPITDLPTTIGWTSGKPNRSGHAFQVDPEWWRYLRNRAFFDRPWREGDPIGKDGKLKPQTMWELRGDRHQSVIIGAHPETEGYRWLPGCSPQELGVPAPAPEWLLEALLVQELPDAPPLQPSAADADRAVAMLNKIPPDDHSSYDSWLRIGMALHHTDPGLRDAWVNWSRGMGGAFDEGECLKKWDSFGKGHRGRQATIGTLYFLATQYGYQEPKKQRAKSKVVPINKKQAQSVASQLANLPANFQDLIQGLPDGWRRTKDGVEPSRISVGQMAQLIEGKKGELLRFNEMKLLVEARTTNGWQPVNDAEMDSGYVLLDQKGWIIGLESVIKALCHVARQRSIHPVREYLLRIEQDQSIKPYDLDRVGPDMFRAVLPLHAAMLRKWLVGAVARALEPGCQMDFALVLHSPKQGIRKTSSFNELASPDWFNSTVPDGDKDFLLNVHSCWIFELAELESVTGQRAAGRLKNLITTRRDLVRVPYGRTPEHRKRSGVFCGTVNTDSFLRDDTGDRRFWVVPIEGDEKLDVQGIRQHRDSIWKAAVRAHCAGELPMLTDEQEGESEQQNERFKVQDAWLEMLQLWMAGAPLARVNDDDPTPRSYQDDGMYSSAEIIYSAGLKRPDQIGRGDETRVGPLLKSLGFTASRVVVGNSKLRRWLMDQPRTNRTNLDQPKNVEVGPWELVAGEGVSGNGPTGPTKNSKLGKKDKRRETGEQVSGIGRESLKEEVGPDGPPAETTSVCSGLEWTNPPPAEVGPGRSKVGPGPVFDQNWPVWLPDLLAIREANPGQLPSIYANDLMAKHQVSTDGRTVKAHLDAWDATHPPATA